MAFTYSSVNINNGSGEAGQGTIFEDTFVIVDWNLNINVYELSFSQATHGGGSSVLVQTFELVSSEYREVECDVIVAATGDVTVQISANPDLRFDGKVVIKGI